MILTSRWVTAFLLITPSLAVVMIVTDFPILRPVVTSVSMFLCPGLGVVRLMRISGLGSAFALSVGVSLAISTIVAEVLLYTDHWSPTMGMIIITLITYTALHLSHSGTGREINFTPSAWRASWRVSHAYDINEQCWKTNMAKPRDSTNEACRERD